MLWQHQNQSTTTTNVSLDGVMQGLGAPDEDRSGGFDRGGWAIPLLDTETRDYLNPIYGGAAAFLFGQRTYEIFAGYWGATTDPSTIPIAAELNSRPKYVASTSLTDPKWAGTTVLTGDVAAAFGDLKTHQDGELLVPGSGALVRWLLANDRADPISRRGGHPRSVRGIHRDTHFITDTPSWTAGTSLSLSRHRARNEIQLAVRGWPALSDVPATQGQHR